jgi:nucleotide-binding universal stress UspA family protein
MYRRVAVALDDSPESQLALRWAVSIAQRANCPLDLLRVAVPAIHGTDLYAAAVLSDADIERMEREAEKELRDMADEVASEGVSATPVVLQGKVPSALADHLRESDVDLAVMTTHDHGRLERILLGRVSESVVRHSHIPVLLVRSHDTEIVVDVEPAAQRILVPIDGSAFSEQILAPAVMLAKLMKSSITLLSVVEPMLANAAVAIGIEGEPTAGLVSRPLDARDDKEQALLESQTLERTAERVRSMDISVDLRVLVDARPAHVIVDFAREHAIDLIAMTTHGRGALKRFAVGSVTEAVLTTARANMLLYRPEHPAPS